MLAVGARAVLSGREMRELDRRAIEGLGVPGVALMENAGKAVATAAIAGKERPRVLVLCGAGNNGGDGFVAARFLRNAETTVALLGAPSKLRGDALVNYRVLCRSGMRPRAARSAAVAARLFTPRPDVIVDAILGTGIRGQVKGFLAQVIRRVNRARSAGSRIVCVDIPSGLPGDEPVEPGTVVRGHLTVTMGMPLVTMVTHPGRDYVGELEVADIGFPAKALSSARPAAHLLDRDVARALFPSRPRGGHKGTFGHLLVIAGSPGMTGAGILAADAGLRCGTGLVTLAVPGALAGRYRKLLLEVMQQPVGTGERHAEESVGELVAAAAKKTAAVFGPGAGRAPTTGRLLEQLLARLRIPVLVDADGLYHLQSRLPALRRRSAPTVVTPHVGEMAGLLGATTAEVDARKVGTAIRAAKRWGCVVVLKSATTVVASPDGDCFVNTAGNPGMATAGSGDVLSGAIGAYLARGLPALEAALLGTFAHSLAGDLAAADRGEESLVAGDIFRRLPEAVREMRNG